MVAKGSNVLGSTLFGAYYSTDFGESWAGGLPPGIVRVAAASSPIRSEAVRYTLATIGNVFHQRRYILGSLIEGFPGVPKPDVEASCADDNYLFAGTFGDGVWRKPLNPLLSLSRSFPERATALPGLSISVCQLLGLQGGRSEGGGQGTTRSSLVSPILSPADRQRRHRTGNVSASAFSGNAHGRVSQDLGSKDDHLNGFGRDRHQWQCPWSRQFRSASLLGDTNGNRVVNASDVAQTKAQSGVPVTSLNFRQDVSASGAINASDIALAKSASGTSVP